MASRMAQISLFDGKAYTVELELRGTKTPLVVDVLRDPLKRASLFIEGALCSNMVEADTGKVKLELGDVPNSAWMKILHLVHEPDDQKSCAPTVEEGVPMFAAIDFLLPNANTTEGRALKRLAESCVQKVDFLRKKKRDWCVALAIKYGVENDVYGRYRTQHLMSIRQRLADGYELDTSWQSPEKVLRAHPPAQVTITDGENNYAVAGCGYAMALVSDKWGHALPKIQLQQGIAVSIWDKILRVVHRAIDPMTWGPTIDDAASILDAIESIQPLSNSSTGRALIGIAEQCRTLLKAKPLVATFLMLYETNKMEEAAETAHELSQCDRVDVVAWLDQKAVDALLMFNPWKQQPFELIIDYTRCSGRQVTTKVSPSSWSCCPSALREEAIALGILPEPAALVPDSLHLTRKIIDSDCFRICFLDAGQLVTYYDGHITSWNVHTGERINKFPLVSRFSGSSESPTHGCVLSNDLVASVDDNCFRTSEPNLWNLKDGALVTRLEPTKDFKAPIHRAQAYRYIASGREEGAGMCELRVGVWGKRSFNDSYEYLNNFSPDTRYCHAIVVHGSSLFICAYMRNSDCIVTIEEINLDTNTLTRTWTVETKRCESPTLLATRRHVVVAVSDKVLVYDRSSLSNNPIHELSHEEAFRYAISGYYLLSLAMNNFKIWDLRSGEIVQVVHNPTPEDDFNRHWRSVGHWESVGFEGHTVVVGNWKGLMQVFQAQLS